MNHSTYQQYWGDSSLILASLLSFKSRYVSILLVRQLQNKEVFGIV